MGISEFRLSKRLYGTKWREWGHFWPHADRMESRWLQNDRRLQEDLAFDAKYTAIFPRQMIKQESLIALPVLDTLYKCSASVGLWSVEELMQPREHLIRGNAFTYQANVTVGCVYTHVPTILSIKMLYFLLANDH